MICRYCRSVGHAARLRGLDTNRAGSTPSTTPRVSLAPGVRMRCWFKARLAVSSSPARRDPYAISSCSQDRVGRRTLSSGVGRPDASNTPPSRTETAHAGAYRNAVRGDYWANASDTAFSSSWL